MRIDARLPLRFGAAAGVRDGDAVLLPDGAAAPAGFPAAWMHAGTGTAAGHPAGCSCCLPRNGAAAALGALFLQRGQGRIAWFGSVLAAVGPDDEALVRAALSSDPLVSGRFRLVEGA